MGKNLILHPNGHCQGKKIITPRTVAATLKFARQLGKDGPWKTLELYASADVEPGIDITTAHAYLYEELAEAIRRQFFRGEPDPDVELERAIRKYL